MSLTFAIVTKMQEIFHFIRSSKLCLEVSAVILTDC